MVPGLTASIFLGQEPDRVSFIPRSEEKAKALKLFERIGVAIDPDKLCRDLSVAEQQVVEIAKALSQDARILVMDEPTAALTPGGRWFAQGGWGEDPGIGIIYISHRLDEIEGASRTV